MYSSTNGRNSTLAGEGVAVDSPRSGGVTPDSGAFPPASGAGVRSVGGPPHPASAKDAADERPANRRRRVTPVRVRSASMTDVARGTR
jgi:hypothetical protein